MHSLAVMVLAAWMILSAAPCSAQFFFSHSPVTLDNLDGNFRTIAACAYEHLARRQNGLSKTEYIEQGVVRIASNSLMEGWELSFVRDDAGRQTRLDWTAGAYPSEFVLSTVRACAA